VLLFIIASKLTNFTFDIMALTKDISLFGCYQFAFDGGVATTQTDATLTIPDAYIVVHSVEGTKQSLSIVVHLRGKDIAVTKLFKFKPTVDGASDNFIKQAYQFLKTLPEFSDATDC
jgi:hypothetical protein